MAIVQQAHACYRKYLNVASARQDSQDWIAKDMLHNLVQHAKNLQHLVFLADTTERPERKRHRLI